MASLPKSHSAGRWHTLAMLLLPLLLPVTAHASIFQGETLDKVADAMTWVVLIVAPTVAIGVFLLIHILPEKIAEKKGHPQTKAIQCLCLLSLAFGGMLWPVRSRPSDNKLVSCLVDGFISVTLSTLRWPDRCPYPHRLCPAK